MATLDDFDSAVAGVMSAAAAVQRDVNSLQELCGKLSGWRTCAMKLDSEPLAQIASCAPQVDLGLIRSLAIQIHQGVRKVRVALDKARDAFPLLDRADQQRAIQLHPEVEQDAMLRGAILEQISVCFSHRPVQ
jgi:hypothetical protein